MNQNNVLKYLIPVVAIIVLGESVMLIGRLGNGQTQMPLKEVTKQTVVPTIENTTPVVKAVVYGIEISTVNKNLTLNKSGTVEVKMTADAEKAVDSVNVYVKYNPEAFDISNLTFDKKLPKPTFEKVSVERGLVVANFLVSAPQGLKISQGEVISLMTFKINPKKTGVFNFEISTGNEMKESATMIVENATSEVLPYSSNKLTVNVTR